MDRGRGARGQRGSRRLLEAADIGWVMEFGAAGGARDGCWKPQILEKAPGEGTMQSSGEQRGWTKQVAGTIPAGLKGEEAGGYIPPVEALE